MGGDDRDRKTRETITEIEKLINSFQLDAAQHKLDKLRSDIGNQPDLVRLSTRIDRFGRKAQ